MLAHPSPIPLADYGIDRAGHRRTDGAWLAAAAKSDSAQYFLLKDGQVLVETGSGAGLLWLGPNATMLAADMPSLFLGETTKGSPVFALNLPNSFSLDRSPIAGLGAFADFRMAGGAMSPFDAGLAATARALFEWRRRHSFCANCGSKVTMVDAGWKSQCLDCKAEHFPRTDPVAIMLPVLGDKCLLGRQAAWPERMWSCLAGFVEPGETFEQAAAREVFEEAGVATTGEAEYLFCQPWPFPSSLMIGLILQAASEDIRIDPSEIEQARWFTRDEIRQAMAGLHPDMAAPRAVAVAHHIIAAWASRDT